MLETGNPGVRQRHLHQAPGVRKPLGRDGWNVGQKIAYPFVMDLIRPPRFV
jgi:hypothetical protein